MSHHSDFIPVHPAARFILRHGAAFGLIGAASVAWGAVSLDITKPPVIGGPGAGPPHDGFATQGQWFVDDRTPSGPFVRSHEFHDNIPGQGGGLAGSLAIKGNVTVINGGGWSPGQAINSFTVRTTVFNDTSSWTGNWANGGNSHGELRLGQPGDPYVGALLNSWLTVEFALADLGLQPGLWNSPYSQQLPEIIATNEDGRAWYCFSSDAVNPGNYFVPAWDFGSIPVNQSVTRDLTFSVNGGILPSDPRYNVLAGSDNDILMNRTTDLKIGDWVDVPAIDTGLAYPVPAALSGNASLFHIPEPGTVSLLGLIGLLLLRRRR